jgi:hypothetical protein
LEVCIKFLTRRFTIGHPATSFPILHDCHSGNLRRVVVVASTAPFGPSALMESMGPITHHGFEHGEEKFLYAAVHRGWED